MRTLPPGRRGAAAIFALAILGTSTPSFAADPPPQPPQVCAEGECPISEYPADCDPLLDSLVALNERHVALVDKHAWLARYSSWQRRYIDAQADEIARLRFALAQARARS